LIPGGAREVPSTRRDGGGDLTGVYRVYIMDDRERTRRQLALETKRRQKLFEEKAKRRQMEEEKLVRLARSPDRFRFFGQRSFLPFPRPTRPTLTTVPLPASFTTG
tara:strand:+ start:542 stop:859 length:318 start_codon:yes stop_codon:yes gene_type:complete